jgi:hypothetical protein
MSDPQRPEREAIERLRELLAKATPGPWKAESKNLGHAEYRAVGPAVINRAAADRDAELIALLRNLAPALRAEVARLQEELNGAWWALGHSYRDRFGVLSEALKDVAARLDKAENPPTWADGFDAGKRTNEFLTKAATQRADRLEAEAQALRALKPELDAEVLRLEGQQADCEREMDECRADPNCLAATEPCQDCQQSRASVALLRAVLALLSHAQAAP